MELDLRVRDLEREEAWGWVVVREEVGWGAIARDQEWVDIAFAPLAEKKLPTQEEFHVIR